MRGRGGGCVSYVDGINEKTRAFPKVTTNAMHRSHSLDIPYFY